MKEVRARCRYEGIVFVTVLVLLVLLVQPCAATEDPAKYPSKPITLIVPWGVGGSTDLACRRIAEAAGKIMGQPIVVENRAGGGGVIGQAAGAKAPSDGYTLVALTHSSSVIVPHLRPVPYNMKEDFDYILQFGSYAFIFAVQSDFPAKTFKEFVEIARKKPDMKYTSSGPQSAQHIFMEQVFNTEKVKLSHIPTSGGAEGTRQLLGGHLDGAITPDLLPQIKNGQLRGLAILASERTTYAPEVPTFYELGYTMPGVNWMGIAAPRGLDPKVRKKLADALKTAYEDLTFRDSMSKLYVPPIYKDGQAFKKMVITDYDNMGRVLRELGFIKN